MTPTDVSGSPPAALATAGADSTGTVDRPAAIYSLIASAERHGADPQRYLTSVLAKIACTPADELGQFLPDVWRANDAKEPKLQASSTA